MSAIGWLTYWLARISGYIAHNMERGWNQPFRTDYDEPLKWKDRR